MIWTLAGLAAILLLAFYYLARSSRATLARWRCAKLHELFAEKRAELTHSFLAAARQLGSPKGLRWVEASWEETGELLCRDRQNGLVVMLVPVALQFEAIAGGEMEDVEAVSLAKQASAVFYFDSGRWQTQGKAVFNLDPAQVLERFAAQYEPLDSPQTVE